MTQLDGEEVQLGTNGEAFLGIVGGAKWPRRGRSLYLPVRAALSPKPPCTVCVAGEGVAAACAVGMLKCPAKEDTLVCHQRLIIDPKTTCR